MQTRENKLLSKTLLFFFSSFKKKSIIISGSSCEQHSCLRLYTLYTVFPNLCFDQFFATLKTYTAIVIPCRREKINVSPKPSFIVYPAIKNN